MRELLELTNQKIPQWIRVVEFMENKYIIQEILETQVVPLKKLQYDETPDPNVIYETRASNSWIVILKKLIDNNGDLLKPFGRTPLSEFTVYSQRDCKMLYKVLGEDKGQDELFMTWQDVNDVYSQWILNDRYLCMLQEVYFEIHDANGMPVIDRFEFNIFDLQKRESCQPCCIFSVRNIVYSYIPAFLYLDGITTLDVCLGRDIYHEIPQEKRSQDVFVLRSSYFLFENYYFVIQDLPQDLADIDYRDGCEILMKRGDGKTLSYVPESKVHISCICSDENYLYVEMATVENWGNGKMQIAMMDPQDLTTLDVFQLDEILNYLGITRFITFYAVGNYITIVVDTVEMRHGNLHFSGYILYMIPKGNFFSRSYTPWKLITVSARQDRYRPELFATSSSLVVELGSEVYCIDLITRDPFEVSKRQADTSFYFC